MPKDLKAFTDQELMVIERTGIDADNFLRNNEFYTKHLKPGLDRQREIAKADGDWSPGKSTEVETIALINAFNSGKRMGLAGIEAACRHLMAQGESASQELARRTKAAKPK